MLEMIAIIAIIGLTLVGLVSLALQSIQTQRVNKYGLTAAMLAQEGIELVRNRRDSSWVSGLTSWTDTMANGTYLVDYTGLVSTGASSVADPVANLKIDGGGFYGYGSGTSTPFNRVVVISDTSAASSTVTSMVRYGSGGNFYTYTAETILYDWNK